MFLEYLVVSLQINVLVGSPVGEYHEFKGHGIAGHHSHGVQCFENADRNAVRGLEHIIYRVA